MILRLVRLMVMISVLLVPVGIVPAQSDGVDIRVLPPLDFESSVGYAVYEVLLENRTEEDKRVDLDIRGAWGEGLRITSLRRRVSVPAGEAVRTKLLQPPARIGDAMFVRVDGRERSLPIHFPAVDHYSHRLSYTRGLLHPVASDAPLNVLISGRVDRALEGELDHRISSMAVVLPRKDLEFLTVNREPTEWPTDPLSYSRLTGMILTSDEFSSMPPAARDAIAGWVRTGGALLVVGGVSESGVRSWFGLAQEDERVSGGTVRLGFGSVMTIPLEPSAIETEVLADEALKWLSYMSLYVDNSRQYPSVDGESVMSVSPAQRIPVRSLMVVLFLFVLLVGPANLIVLARLRQRTLFYVTVPLMGAIFAFGIFGFGIFRSGISPIAKTASLTILDQANRVATTRAHRGYYAPLTPGDGLRFDSDTQVRLLVPWHRNSFEWSRSLTIDLTDGQHLRSGWIRPRVPEHFLFTKDQTRRERLSFTGTASGGYEVLNGLGTDIGRLYYATDEGLLFFARDVEAGARAPLRALRSDDDDTDSLHVIGVDRTDVLEMCSVNGEERAATLARNPASTGSLRVPHNGYVALLKTDPFLEPGLANLRAHEERAVVVGLLEDRGEE